MSITATCFQDFNPKNTNPWYDNEVWMQNSGLYLPIHRKCQIWPWFCKYIETTEHLEPPVWSLETLDDVNDRIQPITRPRLNSTNKTNQTIAKIQNVRPNHPIAKPEATDRKLSAKMLLSVALEDGSSLFQWLEQYLSHSVQAKTFVLFSLSQRFHVGPPSLAGSWRTCISGDGDVAGSHTKELLVGPSTAWLAKNAKTKSGWPNAQSSDATWCNEVHC